MQSQLNYTLAKAHIDDLIRAAEKERLAGGDRPPASTRHRRRPVRRRWITRTAIVTAPPCSCSD